MSATGLIICIILFAVFYSAISGVIFGYLFVPVIELRKCIEFFTRYYTDENSYLAIKDCSGKEWLVVLLDYSQRYNDRYVVWILTDYFESIEAEDRSLFCESFFTDMRIISGRQYYNLVCSREEFDLSVFGTVKEAIRVIKISVGNNARLKYHGIPFYRAVFMMLKSVVQ